MVESKFSFFQVQVKRVLSDTIELGQAPLCVAPERRNAGAMFLPVRKFVLARVRAKVFIKTNIAPSSVTAPAVGMKHRAGVWGVACPRIMPCRVAFEQSGTISV